MREKQIIQNSDSFLCCQTWQILKLLGGDYVNVLIMERMLMDQKKQFQYIMEQRNKKLVKLKHKVGKLKNTIEFLKAENEKQHK